MKLLSKESTFMSVILIFFLILANSKLYAQSYSLTVSAGDLDRSESIVSFYLPEVTAPGIYRMESEAGQLVDVQVDEDHRGWFILDQLSAGESRTYQLNPEPVTLSGGVSISIGSDLTTFQADGQDVLGYYHGYNSPPEELDERYRRGGYIHPVTSPGGVVLTNHLNPDQHPHHSGIWSAWTNTQFQGRTPDFWNVHANTGRVDQADSLEHAWEGPVHAGLTARHHFVDLSASVPVIALNEEWQIRVYPSVGGGNFRLFDLKVTQTANTAQPLFLPEYRYGGVGFRGHVDWDDPDNATFLTSEGLGRDGHGTRVRWTHIGGHSDGELAGIAILGHPGNYRHPQTVRIHPNEPFFFFFFTQLGDMIIEPGSPYVVHYRYITYDGEPDAELIDQMWQDYAYPVGVTVRKQ